MTDVLSQSRYNCMVLDDQVVLHAYNLVFIPFEKQEIEEFSWNSRRTHKYDSFI